VRKQGQESSQYRTIQSVEGDKVITAQKLIHHIETLKEKHDRLDKEITELEAHHTDHLKVETLKKLKLKVKDDIELNQQKLNKLL
jgi:uncharacterized protein YdcH (DUF465 family)